MTLLSAFYVLFNKYSGQEDIVVGSPIANRQREELEGLIGFFVNTLALRANIKDNMSFTDLLEQVKKTTLEGYANQDIPFERLVDSLAVQRSLASNPLFQVMFAFQNNEESSFCFNSLDVLDVKTEIKTSLFDLTLSFKKQMMVL